MIRDRNVSLPLSVRNVMASQIEYETTHREPGDPRTYHDDLVERLLPRVLAPLLRRDQRQKAERYILALLAAPGRKTLRNLAQQMGGGTAQQSVHHFISSSSWRWSPVRRCHTQLVEWLIQPQVWVVKSIVIPKVGRHSVGVEQQLSESGQAVNAQRAYGAWLASDRAAVPCNWQLVLPRSWLDDPGRRSRAHIPRQSQPVTLEEWAASTIAPAAGRWGQRRRPVVVDAEGLDVTAAVGHFDRGAGGPVLLRVQPETRVRVDGGALRSFDERVTEVGHLVGRLRQFRRPLHWRAAGGVPRAAVAAAIPVLLPEAAGRRMLLLAEWAPQLPGGQRLWLATSRSVSLADLPRLTAPADRVERDFAEVSDRVGVRDFAGRSFPGWHRHITLASVAHLAAVLGDSTRGLGCSGER